MNFVIHILCHLHRIGSNHVLSSWHDLTPPGFNPIFHFKLLIYFQDETHHPLLLWPVFIRCIGDTHFPSNRSTTKIHPTFAGGTLCTQYRRVRERIHRKAREIFLSKQRFQYARRGHSLLGMYDVIWLVWFLVISFFIAVVSVLSGRCRRVCKWHYRVSTRSFTTMWSRKFNKVIIYFMQQV